MCPTRVRTHPAGVFALLYAENIPDWLWIMLAAAGMVTCAAAFLLRRYESNRKYLAKARHDRRVVRARTWHWLYARTTTRRLTDRRGQDSPTD